jgi:hypothetical protein
LLAASASTAEAISEQKEEVVIKALDDMSRAAQIRSLAVEKRHSTAVACCHQR